MMMAQRPPLTRATFLDGLCAVFILQIYAMTCNYILSLITIQRSSLLTNFDCVENLLRVDNDIMIKICPVSDVRHYFTYFLREIQNDKIA